MFRHIALLWGGGYRCNHGASSAPGDRGTCGDFDDNPHRRTERREATREFLLGMLAQRTERVPDTRLHGNRFARTSRCSTGRD